MTRTSRRALWVSLALVARGVGAAQASPVPVEREGFAVEATRRATGGWMDFEKLLAALQEAARTPADAPLIATDHYVAGNSDDPAGDRDAARRFVAAFAFWLVTHGKVAADVPRDRAAILSSIASRPDQSARVIEELGDRLLPSDVHAGWKGFVAEYLAPREGGLADDYWKLFVEAPGKRTMRDVHPTRSDYERLARQIETRAERYQQGASDWRTPVEVPGAPEPSLWTGGTKDAWLRRIATYEDLADSLPLHYRARLEEFWSLVDAAPSMPDLEVAAALARTYLWGIDSSVQQSVYRALGGLPPELRLRGVLAHIVEIEAKTADSEDVEVVDVFPDDLDETELGRLAEGIEAAPADQRAAYLRALTRAVREDSRHARRLLKILRRRARS